MIHYIGITHGELLGFNFLIFIYSFIICRLKGDKKFTASPTLYPREKPQW